VKGFIFLFLTLCFAFKPKGQPINCVFKKPVITIHFGTGNSRDVNTTGSFNYERVRSSCPTDGHYSYTPYTSECFSGDWFTIIEDHTAGDESGNMLLVNSSYRTGAFLTTTINGLKGGTIYEFGVWLMNVCKISEKCPYPLLPNISIFLQTPAGTTIGKFNTGLVARTPQPQWRQHKVIFTTPANVSSLTLVMINNNPGGCGNDFALDDITFRECVKQPPPVVTTPKKTVVAKKPPSNVKPISKPVTQPATVKTRTPKVDIVKTQKDSVTRSTPAIKPKPRDFPPPPAALRTRTNDLVKQIETEAGQIKINLYDNGEIDGDTISIYHNNVLLMAHARLSQKPITLSIPIDESQPYHEFVMVAENLGSIPPNTSLMSITAGSQRYEVFISSNEQRNAKVVFRLKEY
jgi:hypothetical protein